MVEAAPVLTGAGAALFWRDVPLRKGAAMYMTLGTVILAIAGALTLTGFVSILVDTFREAWSKVREATKQKEQQGL